MKAEAQTGDSMVRGTFEARARRRGSAWGLAMRSRRSAGVMSLRTLAGVAALASLLGAGLSGCASASPENGAGVRASVDRAGGTAGSGDGTAGTSDADAFAQAARDLEAALRDGGGGADGAAAAGRAERDAGGFIGRGGAGRNSARVFPDPRERGTTTGVGDDGAAAGPLVLVTGPGGAEAVTAIPDTLAAPADEGARGVGRGGGAEGAGGGGGGGGGGGDLERDELLLRLAEALARDATDPTRARDAAVALAALEAVQPGLGGRGLEAAAATLNGPDRAAVLALRDLFARLPSAAAKDPAAIASLLRERAEALSSRTRLTIPRALLARRVTGFGQYVPLESDAIIAGRRRAALVYVEVAGFSQRAAGAEGRVEDLEGPGGGGGSAETRGDDDRARTIELSLELGLYHDSDGVLAWHSPEQGVREQVRSPRRDFYLLQRINLPATLSIGAYTLKATVRDRATGQTSEVNIPLRVVADASAAGPR